MQIYGPSQVHGAQSIHGPHAARPAESLPTSESLAPSDRLDISEAGRIAAQLSEIPDIRADRVAEIRAALANGSYEALDKLDVAVDRLLDEIA
jgi:negative regulator of flagellin synthesis FlgM